jgi:hypothetical protein
MIRGVNLKASKLKEVAIESEGQQPVVVLKFL